MSVWDDPEIREGGEFVKFETVGDTISGTITALRTHRFEDGKVVPQVLIATDTGEERTITAGQVRLKAALSSERPEPGDHLTVTYTQNEKRAGGKTLKHFDVAVRRAGAPAAVAAAPPAAPAPAPTVANGVPAGVDPAVWAVLPPEQRNKVLAAMSTS